jgi:hypothetical protein
VQARWRNGVYAREQKKERRGISPSVKKQLIRKKAV